MEPNQPVKLLILLLFTYLLCPQISSGQIKNGQTYYIKLATGTNYIRPANGEAATRVLLQARNKTTASKEDFKWRMISAGRGYYFFIHHKSGLAMDIRSSRAERGSDIWLATWTGSESQKFRFDMREKGQIFIESKKNPSLVLNTKMGGNYTLELNRRDASFLDVWKVEPTEENRTGGGLPAPMPNLSKIYRSGDTFAFLQYSDKYEVFGLLESPNSSIVFKGLITPKADGSIVIRAEKVAVPKGDGRLAISGYRNRIGDIKVSRNGALVSYTQYTEHGSNIVSLPSTTSSSFIGATKSPGFQNASGNGLTGIWVGDDGGHYYLHQLEDGRVVWFGEKASGHGQPQFANVLIGTWKNIAPIRDEFGRAGVPRFELEGTWVDIPKGKTRGKGRLLIQGNANALVKKSGSGFGAKKFTRVRYLKLDITRLIAKTKDACGEMDFFGHTRIGEQQMRHSQRTGNNIDPNWVNTVLWWEDKPLPITITVDDWDDGLRCGGGNDMVDINPQKGRDNEPKAFRLYLDVYSNGAVFQRNKDGSRGKKIGQAQFYQDRTDHTISLEGDVTNSALNMPGPSSREECAKIEFKLSWAYMKKVL